MNEKTQVQIERMKAQTFGVEVKISDITREDAAWTAHRFLDRCYRERTNFPKETGNGAWSTWDFEGREWRFQRDPSFAGPDDERCKLMAPVQTGQDLELFLALLGELRGAGALTGAWRRIK